MERTEAVTSSFIWRPNANANAEITPSCPRCGSSNTKFCYYNNYSLTQPRYFCKGCRRYWTKGGSLRNVPVGGGCRKSRRPKSSSGGGGNAKNSLTANSCTSRGGGGGGGTRNIDLALVYANFLNPKPDDDNDMHALQENNAFETAVARDCLVDMDPTWSMEMENQHIVDECGGGGYINGLPPFPGEELLSIETNNNGVWSNHHALLIGHHDHNHLDTCGGVSPVQACHEPVVHFGDESSSDSTNLLFGSWSPFDFSTDG
ncbi:unnamed protein product [Cochlearia groenlandica]